ncbi:MAG: PKD domain-containing protein [Bacteroidota bacterium]
MTKINTLIIVFLVSVVSLNAQNKPLDWQEAMIERSVSFEEIQESFNAAWEGKSYEKGKGYKQFKRWEYINRSRLIDGNHPPADIAWKEIKKLGLNKANSQLKNLGSWTSIGPTNVFPTDNAGAPGLGRVNVIAVSPSDPNTIFIGAPAGGLWKTENAGNSWTPLTDNLMSIGISGIAIDPNNEDIIYIGTGDGDGSDTYSIGVLKSLDGGQSWNETGLTFNTSQSRTFNELIFDPEDSDILYAATSNGLYKTIDAGDNWVNLLSGNIEDVAIHPLDNQIIYACTDEFFKSINAGESFEEIEQGLPSSFNVRRFKMALSPDEPDYVYLVAGDQSDDGFLGLYRSTDTGESFDLRSNSPNILHWSQSGNGDGGQSWYDLAIAADPDDADRIFVGGVNVWSSDDGGVNWDISSHWVFPNSIGYTHADIHFLSFENGIIYCGSDGGIYRSENDGNTWNDLSDGLGITQFYRIGVSETNPDLILGGTQDNGTFLFKEGNWFNVLGADGMECLIYPNDEDRMIGSIYFGSLSRSLNGADSWNAFSDGVDENGAWVTPFEIDPQNPNNVFAAYDNVWKHENGFWTQISEFGSSDFFALRVAPSNSDYIYAAKSSALFRTTDGGENWENITVGLPGVGVEYIEVDPDNPDRVYTVHGGFSSGEKVFMSEDGGQTWQNISYNLPNVPVNCIEFQNGSDGGIYIGTDIGIFYTDNALVNWTPFMNGLPNTVIRELEIHDQSQKIRAATFGRGIWESSLYQGFTEVPTADFESNRFVICAGESIDFTDISIGNDGGWDWEFEGGSPSISEDQNPTITYNTPGSYQVTLTVDNANGSGTEIKTAFIHVLENEGLPSPFAEPFENVQIPGDWFVNNPDGQVTWEISSSSGNIGLGSAYINNITNTEGQTDELQSPTIDLSSATDAVLSFYVAYSKKGESDDDRLRVYVSKDCGENWSLRKTITANGDLETGAPQVAPFAPEADQWNFIEVTNILESFYVENFRMMFRWESGGGNNIYLDDINLIGTVSNNDISIDRIQLQLFPNPSEGQSTLAFSIGEAANATIYITDLNGKKVASLYAGNLNAGQQSLNFDSPELANGTYLIVIELNDQLFSKKWVKK